MLTEICESDDNGTEVGDNELIPAIVDQDIRSYSICLKSRRNLAKNFGSCAMPYILLF